MKERKRLSERRAFNKLAKELRSERKNAHLSPKLELCSGNPDDFKEPWTEEAKQELIQVLEKFLAPDPDPKRTK